MFGKNKNNLYACILHQVDANKRYTGKQKVLVCKKIKDLFYGEVFVEVKTKRMHFSTKDSNMAQAGDYVVDSTISIDKSEIATYQKMSPEELFDIIVPNDSVSTN